MFKKILPVVVLILLSGMLADTAIAQIKEPDVIKKENPKTPLSEGYHNAIGFDVVINNFGFGIGGTYGRAIAPYTELTFRTGITGIRDASEQNFQSFWTGQQIVPNKYKRAFGFPFLLGVKQRLFARHIQDNMRFFVSAAGGPALAFTYPYIRDSDNNGFRNFIAFQTQRGTVLRPQSRSEPINGFFTGWSEGETKWGYSGAIKIGVDLGSEFDSRTTIEFGYFFYYFDQGLQIMEPYKPYGYTKPSDGSPGVPIECMKNGTPSPCNVEGAMRNSFHPAQKYFGTPQIKFTFGGMW